MSQRKDFGNNIKVAVEDFQRESKIEKKFDLVKRDADPRFGEVAILKNKQTGEILMLKESVSNNEREASKDILQVKRRLVLNHPYMQKMFDFSCHKQSNFCSKFYKVRGFYEYPKSDLSREILSRKKNLREFTHEELTHIAYQILLALEYLQDNSIAFGDLRPSHISVDNGKLEYKLLDRLNDPSSTMQSQLNNILANRPLYCSPNIFNCIKSNKKKLRHDPFKSDCFSLGLVLLEAGTLDNLKDIYDQRNACINEPRLEEHLNLFRSKYEEDNALLCDLTQNLLTIDEEDRFNPKQFNEELPPYDEIIEYFQTNPEENQEEEIEVQPEMKEEMPSKDDNGVIENYSQRSRPPPEDFEKYYTREPETLNEMKKELNKDEVESYLKRERDFGNPGYIPPTNPVQFVHSHVEKSHHTVRYIRHAPVAHNPNPVHNPIHNPVHNPQFPNYPPQKNNNLNFAQNPRKEDKLEKKEEKPVQQQGFRLPETNKVRSTSLRREENVPPFHNYQTEQQRTSHRPTYKEYLPNEILTRPTNLDTYKGGVRYIQHPQTKIYENRPSATRNYIPHQGAVPAYPIKIGPTGSGREYDPQRPIQYQNQHPQMPIYKKIEEPFNPLVNLRAETPKQIHPLEQKEVTPQGQFNINEGQFEGNPLNVDIPIIEDQQQSGVKEPQHEEEPGIDHVEETNPLETHEDDNLDYDQQIEKNGEYPEFENPELEHHQIQEEEVNPVEVEDDEDKEPEEAEEKKISPPPEIDVEGDDEEQNFNQNSEENSKTGEIIEETPVPNPIQDETEEEPPKEEEAQEEIQKEEKKPSPSSDIQPEQSEPEINYFQGSSNQKPRYPQQLPQHAPQHVPQHTPQHIPQHVPQQVQPINNYHSQPQPQHLQPVQPPIYTTDSNNRRVQMKPIVIRKSYTRVLGPNGEYTLIPKNEEQEPARNRSHSYRRHTHNAYVNGPVTDRPLSSKKPLASEIVGQRNTRDYMSHRLIPQQQQGRSRSLRSGEGNMPGVISSSTLNRDGYPIATSTLEYQGNTSTFTYQPHYWQGGPGGNHYSNPPPHPYYQNNGQNYRYIQPDPQWRRDISIQPRKSERKESNQDETKTPRKQHEEEKKPEKLGLNEVRTDIKITPHNQGERTTAEPIRQIDTHHRLPPNTYQLTNRPPFTYQPAEITNSNYPYHQPAERVSRRRDFSYSQQKPDPRIYQSNPIHNNEHYYPRTSSKREVRYPPQQQQPNYYQSNHPYQRERSRQRLELTQEGDTKVYRYRSGAENYYNYRPTNHHAPPQFERRESKKSIRVNHGGQEINRPLVDTNIDMGSSQKKPRGGGILNSYSSFGGKNPQVRGDDVKEGVEDKNVVVPELEEGEENMKDDDELI